MQDAEQDDAVRIGEPACDADRKCGQRDDGKAAQETGPRISRRRHARDKVRRRRGMRKLPAVARANQIQKRLFRRAEIGETEKSEIPREVKDRHRRRAHAAQDVDER
jgi:hypothetical protein